MHNVRNLVGHEVQGWALWEILGTGADGIVYMGERAGTQVAVKIFFPEQLQKYGFEQQQQRLELQLQLKGKKHHPNLVYIHDGGFDNDLQTLYLIMEYVPGRSLDKVLDKLPTAAIAPLIHQLAEAARFLEEKDLFHRDIKPANIVISDDYKLLTLLDLGVVIRPPEKIEDRLSGFDFVASVRYSPREFVFRDELGNDANAWRAVTFYQIGATLHDMIMRYPIFEGRDTPPARLFEAVKLHPPEISSDDCPQWLIKLAEACLIKSWRERLKHVEWDSFSGPKSTEDRSYIQEIRRRQVRADELRLKAKEEENNVMPRASRAQDLWRLQRGLFFELRQLIMSEPVFPKFSGSHTAANSGYKLQFAFNKDEDLLFLNPVTIEIAVDVAPETEAATSIIFRARIGTVEILSASWIEMFSIERAAELCGRALGEAMTKAIEY